MWHKREKQLDLNANFGAQMLIYHYRSTGLQKTVLSNCDVYGTFGHFHEKSHHFFNFICLFLLVTNVESCRRTCTYIAKCLNVSIQPQNKASGNITYS